MIQDREKVRRGGVGEDAKHGVQHKQGNQQRRTPCAQKPDRIAQSYDRSDDPAHRLLRYRRWLPISSSHFLVRRSRFCRANGRSYLTNFNDERAGKSERIGTSVRTGYLKPYRAMTSCAPFSRTKSTKRLAPSVFGPPFTMEMPPISPPVSGGITYSRGWPLSFASALSSSQATPATASPRTTRGIVLGPVAPYTRTLESKRLSHSKPLSSLPCRKICVA